MNAAQIVWLSTLLSGKAKGAGGLMSKHILIVEDSTDDQYLLALKLRRLGVTNPIEQLSNGEEAIDYLSGTGVYGDRKQYPLPTVMFLDLRMPRKSGFDVLTWLQANPLPQACLVLVVSDPHGRPDITRAYQLGAKSFLGKPLNEAELRECLRNFPDCWEFGEASP